MSGIFIHAGAHRTGTSSFQQCLADNRARLEGAGYDVVYPGRDGAPGGRLRLDLPRPRHGEKRVPGFGESVARHLAGLRAPGRGLVLSEENIPGPMRHFYEGRFFPAAAKRFAAFAAGVGGISHVIYVLRPYSALYVSAYRKRAEDNAVPDFGDVAPAFLAMDRGWPELVAQMRDGLGARLSVVDYARRGSSVDLLRALVPEAAGLDLVEPARAVNLSATDAALIALQARYRAGEDLRRGAWQAVIGDHAQDTAPLGFAAFSEADKAVLDTRYARDLERVAALDGVDLIA
ncbi:MAG: hypothetical protein AB8B51_13480 [Sedimentitalea sp.]